jgi:hypothetical protein
MAHNMSDLYRVDLVSRGWWIHYRAEAGASGRQQSFRVVEGPGAAPLTLTREIAKRLGPILVEAKQAGLDRVSTGTGEMHAPAIDFDLSGMTLTLD